jgi:hypothetical protein
VTIVVRSGRRLPETRDTRQLTVTIDLIRAAMIARTRGARDATVDSLLQDADQAGTLISWIVAGD